MALNEGFRDADHLSVPVPSGTSAGDALRVGGLNLVAQTDRAEVTVDPTNSDGTRNPAYNYGGGNPQGYASCWLKGSHTFTVAFAIASWGDPVYITPGGALSATSSGNSLYGHALSTKAATSGPLTVRLAN